MSRISDAAKRRLLGAAFLIALVGLLVLSVAVYQKAFTPVVHVTLRADHTGMQLNPGADVKVKGVIVGEVRDIAADGDQAVLRLALDPALVRFVPSDVSARLLPKTLFGERYVALLVPASSNGQPIHSGAVIAADRTDSAVELEQVLNEVLPLLRAVEPDKLAATLSALATALEGRGDQLGRNLVTLGDYLAALNKEMPTITEDIRKLSSVLDTYHEALPDLLTVLRELTVTSRTVTDQRENLQTLLLSTTDMADVTRTFLDRHDARLIQLGDVSRPVLELLATYSPEFPCVLRGLVKLQPRVEDTFSTGRLHVTLEITRDNGKYVKNQDEPAWSSNKPNCRGLPNPPTPFPDIHVPAGYDWSAARSPLPGLPGLPLVQRRDAQGKAVSTVLLDPTMGYAGTAEEQALVKPLVAAATATPADQVSDLAVLLWGPMFRGTVVSAQ